MRIWSIHPKYLDSKGLVALWRETLLAKNVLEAKTRGYRNHPQLDRFKKTPNPVDCINQYLTAVFQESVHRGYHFDRDKIGQEFDPTTLTVTSGQLRYETAHLLKKLKIRDPARYKELVNKTKWETHPLFKVVEGDLEEWEKLDSKDHNKI